MKAKVEGKAVERVQRLQPTPNKKGEAWYDVPCDGCSEYRRCFECKPRLNQATKDSRKKRKLALAQGDYPEEAAAKMSKVNADRRSDYQSLAKVEMRQARDFLEAADKHGRDFDERMRLSPGGSLGSRFDLHSAAYSELWRDHKKAAAKDHLLAACAKNCAEAYCELAVMLLRASTADRPEAFSSSI